MPSLGSCPSCNDRFTFVSMLKRQRCSDCRASYCSKCVAAQLNTHRCVSAGAIQNVKCCMLCKLYRAGPQPGDRSYLASLGVKDLKEYLIFLEVPSHGCISKTDLVDLIVGVADVKKGCRPKSVPDTHRSKQSSASPSSSLPSSSARTHGQPSPAAAAPGTSRSSARDVTPPASSNATGAGRPERRRSSSYTAAAQPPPTAGRTASRSSGDESRVRGDRPPTPAAQSSASAPEGGGNSRRRSSSTTPLPSSLPTQFDQHGASTTATAAATADGASVRHGHRVNLSAINAEDVASMSVLQLKETLAVNFVDFRGCVEKKELVELVMRLWMERHPLPGQATNEREESTISADGEFNECRICMDEPINCVLLECGHMCCCVVCGRKLAECPMCRRYVSRVVHVFKT